MTTILNFGRVVVINVSQLLAQSHHLVGLQSVCFL